MVASLLYNIPSIELKEGLLSSTIMLISPLQLEKAELPIEVTELPIVYSVSCLELYIAELPIEVTELGMVTEVSPLHL